MDSASLTTSRLITLGRLALLSPDGSEEESLQKRRRKIAVLAVLALERRPLSRDVLVEMFWGDQEETRARHSLSDALSHLRRVIGRDAISIGRSEVALAPDAPLAVDATDFAAAIQRQEYEMGSAMIQANGFTTDLPAGDKDIYTLTKNGRHVDQQTTAPKTDEVTKMFRPKR